MKQSNIFKPTLIFSQKTSVSIFVLFVYDMYTLQFYKTALLRCGVCAVKRVSANSHGRFMPLALRIIFTPLPATEDLV